MMSDFVKIISDIIKNMSDIISFISDLVFLRKGRLLINLTLVDHANRLAL